MQQEFKPPALGGSSRVRATDLAHEIARTDYGVADMDLAPLEGGLRKVRYSDEPNSKGNVSSGASSSTWQAGREALEAAISAGRESRLKYGSGLDVLQKGLSDGTTPDLIENSKRYKCIRVW